MSHLFGSSYHCSGRNGLNLLITSLKSSLDKFSLIKLYVVQHASFEQFVFSLMILDISECSFLRSPLIFILDSISENSKFPKFHEYKLGKYNIKNKFSEIRNINVLKR